MTTSEQPRPSSVQNFPVEWYDWASEDHFWMEWRLAVILRHLYALGIDPSSALRGLDIGCGHGAFQRQLHAATDWTIDGCDLNPHAIALAQGSKGRSFLYDIFASDPKLKHCYDLVFLLDVIEHVPNPVEFIRTAQFYLATGGRIVFNVPAVPSLYSNYDVVAGHLRRYTRRQLTAEITAAGLRIERMSYWGMLLVPLLALRKLIASSTRHEDVIRHGFVPSGKLTDRLLRFLMSVELLLPGRLPCGSSLLAITTKG